MYIKPEPYINTNGTDSYFGEHFILDLFGISSFDSIATLHEFLVKAVEKAGATILNSYIHDFGNDGYSGVLVLEESHISIHT